jgi:hypothetical protein
MPFRQQFMPADYNEANSIKQLVTFFCGQKAAKDGLPLPKPSPISPKQPSSQKLFPAVRELRAFLHAF